MEAPIPIVHDWVEPWLAGWIHDTAKTLKPTLKVARVNNREVSPIPAGSMHIVVRDDGGQRRDLSLKDQTIGITWLANSVSDLPAVRGFADQLIAVMESRLPTDAGSPVAHVSEINGPYTVPTGNDQLRLYASMTLTLNGREIAP